MKSALSKNLKRAMCFDVAKAARSRCIKRDLFGILSPTRCATRFKEEVVTSQKKCLPKRKEKRKYFLKRRDHEQYRIFCGEYPNLTGIGSVNAVLAGRSGHHGSLSDSSGSA